MGRRHCGNRRNCLLGEIWERVNPFPNKLWVLRVCSTSLLKTLWEKEKLLIMSNFSFSHSVFYSFRGLPAIFIRFEIVVCKLFQFGRVYNLLFGKGLRQISNFESQICSIWISLHLSL